MDLFKEKCGFVEAIQALKDGYAIKRSGKYYYTYTSAEVNVNGKTLRQYGSLESNGKFKQGFIFGIEDFEAEDWIIVGKVK